MHPKPLYSDTSCTALLLAVMYQNTPRLPTSEAAIPRKKQQQREQQQQGKQQQRLQPKQGSPAVPTRFKVGKATDPHHLAAVLGSKLAQEHAQGQHHHQQQQQQQQPLLLSMRSDDALAVAFNALHILQQQSQQQQQQEQEQVLQLLWQPDVLSMVEGEATFTQTTITLWCLRHQAADSIQQPEQQEQEQQQILQPGPEAAGWEKAPHQHQQQQQQEEGSHILSCSAASVADISQALSSPSSAAGVVAAASRVLTSGASAAAFAATATSSSSGGPGTMSSSTGPDNEDDDWRPSSTSSSSRTRVGPLPAGQHTANSSSSSRRKGGSLLGAATQQQEQEKGPLLGQTNEGGRGYVDTGESSSRTESSSRANEQSGVDDSNTCSSSSSSSSAGGSNWGNPSAQEASTSDNSHLYLVAPSSPLLQHTPTAAAAVTEHSLSLSAAAAGDTTCGPSSSRSKAVPGAAATVAGPSASQGPGALSSRALAWKVLGLLRGFRYAQILSTSEPREVGKVLRALSRVREQLGKLGCGDLLVSCVRKEGSSGATRGSRVVAAWEPLRRRAKQKPGAQGEDQQLQPQQQQNREESREGLTGRRRVAAATKTDGSSSSSSKSPLMLLNVVLLGGPSQQLQRVPVMGVADRSQGGSRRKARSSSRRQGRAADESCNNAANSSMEPSNSSSSANVTSSNGSTSDGTVRSSSKGVVGNSTNTSISNRGKCTSPSSSSSAHVKVEFLSAATVEVGVGACVNGAGSYQQSDGWLQHQEQQQQEQQQREQQQRDVPEEEHEQHSLKLQGKWQHAAAQPACCGHAVNGGIGAEEQEEQHQTDETILLHICAEEDLRHHKLKALVKGRRDGDTHEMQPEDVLLVHVLGPVESRVRGGKLQGSASREQVKL